MEGSFARALYSFQSSNPGELSVPEGGIIRINQYIDNHWLEAEYQGETGFFPVTYAARLKNEPQPQNSVPSVSLSNGRGFQGTITSDEFHRQIHFSDKQDNSGTSFVEASFAFNARNESELTFPTGALLEVTKDVDDDWLEGSFNGRTGLFPKSYVKSSQRPCARAIYPFVGESVGELTFREGDCIYLRKRLNSQWMEGELNGDIGLFPSSFVAVEVDLPPEEGAFLNGDLFFMDLTPKHEAQEKVATSKIQWTVGMKGKALFHFTALYSGDLELNEGDVVTVLRVDDDNWLEGQLANGNSGSCPTAYLEPVYDTDKLFENKQWNARTQWFPSVECFSGNSSYFASNAGTSGASQYPRHGMFSQQHDLFSSCMKTERNGTSLLDSSFTQDPTPILMPSNMSSLDHETKTAERSKPVLKPKPSLKPKPTEGYSVTYLGSKDRKNPSAPKSYQTSISPSISMPSLPDGSSSVSNSYVLNSKVTTVSNGISGQSSVRGQSSSSSYLIESVGTWPRKREGIHGSTFEGKNNIKNSVDDDDDLLSGNCTSLPSPLVSSPQGIADDENNESSASEDSPITPRRRAPPPPKRNSSINQVRCTTLPAPRSKATAQGHYSREALPSKAKGQRLSDGEDIKPTASPCVFFPTETKRDSSLSPKQSPKMRSGGSTREKPQLSRPRSLYWKERGTGATMEKVLKHVHVCTNMYTI